MLGYTQHPKLNFGRLVMPYGTGDKQSSTESIVVLFKGGRLPSWHTLTKAQQDDYSQQHVELMLDVAHTHGMKTLEGFRLMGAKQSWERFGTRIPTLEGAEACESMRRWRLRTASRSM